MALLFPGAVAAAKKSYALEDLMNPLLSPELALWLVGPISRLATDQEIKDFGKLTSDEAARAFVEEFWKRRDRDPAYEGNALREKFEERSKEADRLFTESGVPGHRTDRGAVFVLYGPPAKEEFKLSEHPDDPATLVWNYAADSAPGLDGKKPEKRYQFIRRGELTVFFTPNLRPPRPRPGQPPLEP
mgnify:CR=1 FL=1